MSTATIETRLESADLIAAAITPDNTTEMDTRVDDATDDTATIVTTITRESSGGLRATATDYIANISVATEVVASIDQHTNTDP